MTEQKVMVTSGRHKSGLFNPDQKKYLRRLFTIFILGAVGLGTSQIGSGGGQDKKDEPSQADYDLVNKNIAKMLEADARREEREKRKAQAAENWDKFLEVLHDLLGGERS